ATRLGAQRMGDGPLLTLGPDRAADGLTHEHEAGEAGNDPERRQREGDGPDGLLGVEDVDRCVSEDLWRALRFVLDDPLLHRRVVALAMLVDAGMPRVSRQP